MKTRASPSFEVCAFSQGRPASQLTVIGPQREPWERRSWLLDEVRIRWARDGAGSAFEAAVAGEGTVFMAGIDAVGKMSANGVVFGEDTIVIAPRGSEIRFVSFDVVTWVFVFIPTSKLPVTLEGGRAVQPVQCQVLESPTGDERIFRQELLLAVSAALAGAFNDNPRGRTAAAAVLVTAARHLLSSSPATDERTPQTGRPRISRSQIIRRAHQFLEHHSGEAVRIHSLARVAGVSERTLHSAFMEEYGVSPKRFLHLRVLNAARDELVRCDARNTRVTDVAARLGIWEWGRFARDYRALFGELPSQTLRRAA